MHSSYIFINFSIMMILLIYFGRKPFKKSFAERRMVIEGIVKEAQEKFEKAQKLFNDAHEEALSMSAKIEDFKLREEKNFIQYKEDAERKHTEALQRLYLETQTYFESQKKNYIKLLEQSILTESILLVRKEIMEKFASRDRDQYTNQKLKTLEDALDI